MSVDRPIRWASIAAENASGLCRLGMNLCQGLSSPVAPSVHGECRRFEPDISRRWGGQKWAHDRIDRSSTKARSHSSATRIEFSTRTCRRSPVAQSLYTVAAHNPSRFATSDTVNRRLSGLKYG